MKDKEFADKLGKILRRMTTRQLVILNTGMVVCYMRKVGGVSEKVLFELMDDIQKEG